MLPVDEFGLIARLFAPLAAGCPGALGLKDDAAILSCPEGCELVVTTDVLVGDGHFLSSDPPDAIARKAVRTNVSDLAAMGARPRAILLAACFPRDVTLDWLDLFGAGLRADIEEFGLALIGGDTVATDGPMTFSITALGEVEAGRALKRSNARSGDRIWVSGTIGDGALGLFVELGKSDGLDARLAASLLDRYRLPRPRIALGRALVGVAHAAMDVSDGLVGDLAHICEASGVGALIDAGLVPLSEAGRHAVSTGWGGGLETILSGGDDYELLFTAPDAANDALQDIQRKLGLPLTTIGRIIEGKGVAVVADGRPMPLAKGGHRHF